MSRDQNQQRRKRSGSDGPSSRRYHGARPTRSREGLVAIGVLAAAALATFLALFITSRPYDPMDSTLDPRPEIPASTISLQPSPKPSASATPGHPVSDQPSPIQAGDTGSPAPLDDTAIQAEIEKRIASDTALSGLDISTVVESGKVTLVGSVRSQELKSRVERLVRSIKGVTAVDNQLVVTESMA